MSELGSEPPTARAELRIAAAGPATSMAAGLIFGGLAAAVRAEGGLGIAVAALGWLAAMNMVLAVFNLLPGAPRDGGRILSAVLWRRRGDRVRAGQSAAAAGRVVGALLMAAGLGEVLVWADVGGLWLALIGMFVMTAATAEAAAAALAGLRVGDVMTPDPDIGATWMSAANFIDRVALTSDQDEFPVIGADGSLAGVTGVSRLARIPLARRASTTVGQVMAAVPPAYVAAPDDPAAPLLNRPPLDRDLAAIVITDGTITGIVTITHLRRIVRREALRAQPGPVTGPAGQTSASSPDGRSCRGPATAVTVYAAGVKQACPAWRRSSARRPAPGVPVGEMAPVRGRPAQFPAADAARRSRPVASVTGQGAAGPWLGRLRRPDHEPGTGG